MARFVVLLALLTAASAAPAEGRVRESVRVDAFEPPGAAAARVTPVAPGRAGRLVVVPGRSARSGPGPLRRYAVEVEGGIRIDRRRFAAQVHEVLAHGRSWGGSGRVSFQRVGPRRPADFRVALARPSTTDHLCYPYVTGGVYSCAKGGRAVLNLMRWRRGADAYRGNLRAYRVYLVNHEVGHLLGRGHQYCAAAGARAPVMMQQTKGVGSCRPNAWPLAWERG